MQRHVCAKRMNLISQRRFEACFFVCLKNFEEKTVVRLVCAIIDLQRSLIALRIATD